MILIQIAQENDQAIKLYAAKSSPALLTGKAALEASSVV